MSTSRIDSVLESLPGKYVGPGGAIAILRDGEVVAQRAWGYADLDRRLPFTAQTMSLMCSITKQFTCALLLDQCPDLDALAPEVRRLMPLLEGEVPGVRDLANNQSGLRDYWATAMLCGPAVEGRFTIADGARLIAKTRSLHFAPGTRYSYCNQNFRILSDIIESRTGKDFAGLLRARVFDRAGMPRAALNPDTSRVIGGTIGYEGSVESGFRPAVNRIVWTGDAGLAASLEDMIAWEQHIDATRDDADGLYTRLAGPAKFRDGTPAGYGFGLARGKVFGRENTSHGGGLRGWRSHRMYIPSERVSVVALFNHMADPRAAAMELLAALLDVPEATTPPASAPIAAGRYVEPETGLAVRVAPEGDKMKLHFAPYPELLAAAEDGWSSGGTTLRATPEGLRMQRTVDNIDSLLTPASGTPPTDVAGIYRNAELGAELVVTGDGSALYGAFQGDLGPGTLVPLLPFAENTWLLSMPRALDHGAPGDWTLTFTRDAAGAVAGVTVGCWLARGIAYARV
jgi:D-aminopeptidase